MDASIEAGIDASIADAMNRDARVRDADPVDTGPRDLGPCNCSFGFHTQCAAGEVCARGRPQSEYDFGLIPRRDYCEPMRPMGVCDQPGGPERDPCDAQCGPVGEWSPCQGLDTAHYVDEWIRLLRRAFQPGGTLRIEPQSYDRLVQRGPSSDCNEHVAYSLFGIVELCAGAGSLRLDPSGRLLLHEFGPLPAGGCQEQVLERCFSVLVNGVGRMHEQAVQVFLDVPPTCGADPLPYAAPCTGATGTQCVAARLLTVLRTLDPPR